MKLAFGKVLTIALLAPVCAVSANLHAMPPGNAVLRWNQAALDAIGTTRTAPPIAARALAILHTCMFDAWAAYDDTAVGTRFGAALRRPEAERTQANREVAVSAAAYRALVDLFPGQRMMNFDPLLEKSGLSSALSGDSQSPGGIAIAACNAVLEYRHHDGSNQLGDQSNGAYSDYTGFTPWNTAGMLRDLNRWQPLLVNGVAQRWQLPQWCMVKPFVASSLGFRDRIMSQGPYLYPSASYQNQAMEVLHLSARLTDREKTIAEYWSDGPNTVTPPGHWCLFAQALSKRDRHTLDQDVVLFFALGNALLDASVAAWDVKRCADSIRPVTAIRFLMAGRMVRAWAGPGLGIREIDGNDFRSYLPTPPFGSYVSGHSVFSAAAAEILRLFAGSDACGESVTVLPGTSVVERGLTPSAPVTLTWRTFSEAAEEAGMSRRYGGIHFEKDDVVGQELGRNVAREVWKHAMTYHNRPLR